VVELLDLRVGAGLTVERETLLGVVSSMRLRTTGLISSGVLADAHEARGLDTRRALP